MTKNRFLHLLAAMLISVLVLTPLLSTSAVFARDPHLYDEAGCIDADDAQYLEDLLADYSNTYKLDIVAVFVDSLNGKTPMHYADDWYDSHSRGYGDTEDGILLLVCLSSRDYYICTGGSAVQKFGDSQLDTVESAILGHLSGNDWYGAVCAFGASAVSVVKIPYLKYALIALGIGLVAALIILLVMKSKMNNVKKSTSADNYAAGGIEITNAFEQFLYRNVTKTKRPEPSSNSGGGGGGSHHSSSGSSHGGRGGKF